MSSRSLLEIHTIEVHFNVDRVTLKTDNMEPYFLTVKVSKLISSKNVPLVVTAHGLEPKSPLVVDVLMQYDSILGCYQQKQVRMVLSCGSKKVPVGEISINLCNYLRTRAPISRERPKKDRGTVYMLEKCQDENAKVEMFLQFKLLSVKTGSFSVCNKSSSDISNIENTDLHDVSIVIEKHKPFLPEIPIENMNFASNPPPKFNLYKKKSSNCSFMNRMNTTCNTLPLEESSVITTNLSAITNECRVLKNLLGENLASLENENLCLREAKKEMKTQISHLQYLNGVLLEEETTKDAEISYLSAQLKGTRELLRKFQCNDKEQEESLREQIKWLRESKELSDLQLLDARQANSQLLKTTRQRAMFDHQCTQTSRQFPQQNHSRDRAMTQRIMCVSLQFNRLKECLFRKITSLPRADVLRWIRPLETSVNEATEMI